MIVAGPIAFRASRLLVAAACLATSIGCATAEGPRTGSDPFEPMNRAVYRFNDTLDRAVLEPTATAYQRVIPQPVRDMVGNFFGNLSDAWTSVNQLLQGKPGDAASDAWRVMINTTFGLAGVLDVASEAGIEKHNEDFGQTLGRWGLPAGPYLMLPLLGPSSFRDAPGRAVDIVADPIRVIESHGRRNNAVVLRVVDDRERLFDAERVLDAAALDRYAFLRDAYLQRRRNQVYDGNPPPLSPEDDPDSWLDELDETPDTDSDSPKPAR